MSLTCRIPAEDLRCLEGRHSPGRQKVKEYCHWILPAEAPMTAAVRQRIKG